MSGGLGRESGVLLVIRGVQAHHVGEATVHVDDVARDARGQVGQQEGRRIAHFLDRHVAAQRRVAGGKAQQLAEVLDAGGGQRLDGAGGNAVRADALLAQVFRQVAYRRFQRRLRQAHRVVVGDRAYGTQVRQGQQRRAFLQQRQGGLGHGREAVGGSVVGNA